MNTKQPLRLKPAASLFLYLFTSLKKKKKKLLIGRAEKIFSVGIPQRHNVNVIFSVQLWRFLCPRDLKTSEFPANVYENINELLYDVEDRRSTVFSVQTMKLSGLIRDQLFTL